MHSLFVTLLALSPLSASAANLPLSQAVQEALQNSPALARSASQAEESRWKRTESLSGFLPSVTASASHLLDKKLAYIDVVLSGNAISFPQVVPTTTYGLSARLPIFDGLGNVNRYQAASSLADAAEHDLEWARFQTERQVVLLYYRAMGAKLLEEVATQNLRTLEDHLKDAQNFKRAGVSTNYDLLRVEVQVSEAKSALLDAQDNVAIAKQRLAVALGKQDESREPVGKLPVLAPTVLQRLETPKAEARADLKGLQERVNGFEHLEGAASTHLVPRLSLFGDYTRYNNRNDETFKQAAFRDAYQVGVGLSWNLFDGMASIARSKEAVEQRFQAEKTLEQARLEQGQSFEIWRRKFLYFCSVFESRQSDVQKARESVRLAREGRRVGARTNTELLDAEADSFRAQAGLVNAQLGAVEALLNLESATGQSLYRFY